MLRDVGPRQISGPKYSFVDEVAEGMIVDSVPGADPTYGPFAGDRGASVLLSVAQSSLFNGIERGQRRVVNPTVADDFVTPSMKLFQRIRKVFGDTAVGIDRALNAVSV